MNEYAIENHQVLPCADDGLETMTPAEEDAAARAEELSAQQREGRIRRLGLAMIQDNDIAHDMIDSAMMGYYARERRGDLALVPGAYQRHVEAEHFVESLRRIIFQHPESAACRILMSEMRQRAKQELEDME